jgi:acetyltransferase-like isoleucine patch superfamily enzyme
VNAIVSISHGLVRRKRKTCLYLTRLLLRAKGVIVHETAVIHPAAILEPSGGLITIGPETFVDRGVIIRPLGGSVVIGKSCTIHAYCVLHGTGGLKIGDNVLIATHTVIIPSNHNFSNVSIPIKDQGLSLQGIVIENDVWLGAGVRVLDGVVIGKGSVVGAGAVVTKSVPPHTVAVGVPASPISSRTQGDVNLNHQS